MRRSLVVLLAACAAEEASPSAVVVHRLNRAEYDNTVRDLLQTAATPARAFPLDDRAFGFDNVVEAQRLAPLGMELYAEAAARLAEEAVRAPESVRIEGETIGASIGARYRDVGWRFAQGTLVVPATLAE